MKKEGTHLRSFFFMNSDQKHRGDGFYGKTSNYRISCACKVGYFREKSMREKHFEMVNFIPSSLCTNNTY